MRNYCWLLSLSLSLGICHVHCPLSRFDCSICLNENEEQKSSFAPKPHPFVTMSFTQDMARALSDANVWMVRSNTIHLWAVEDFLCRTSSKFAIMVNNMRSTGHLTVEATAMANIDMNVNGKTANTSLVASPMPSVIVAPMVQSVSFAPPNFLQHFTFNFENMAADLHASGLGGDMVSVTITLNLDCLNMTLTLSARPPTPTNPGHGGGPGPNPGQGPDSGPKGGGKGSDGHVSDGNDSAEMASPSEDATDADDSMMSMDSSDLGSSDGDDDGHRGSDAPAACAAATAGSGGGRGRGNPASSSDSVEFFPIPPGVNFFARFPRGTRD